MGSLESARLKLLSGTGMSRATVGLCWLLMACGCAPAQRQAVHYSGEEHAARIEPADLHSVERVPVGFESFGRLETSCEVWQPGGPVRERWLADLDCTVARLRDVLRDKAAAVGAEVLVRPRCGWSGTSKRNALKQVQSGRLVCRARVARPAEHLRARESLGDRSRPSSTPELAANATQAARLDDPTAAAAWRIRVSYRPNPVAVANPERMHAKGPRLPASAVRELSDLPASHRELGTVITDCDANCSEAVMRASVRVAAARLGASDVVGVRCVPLSPGWHCVGTLAKPLVDP